MYLFASFEDALTSSLFLFFFLFQHVNREVENVYFSDNLSAVGIILL